MTLSAVFNHLWQSTLFAAVAALLALALRHNHARIRCWLWLAASIKFLIPFSLLVGIGRQLGWRTVHAAAQTPFKILFVDLSEPFGQREIRVVVQHAYALPIGAVLVSIWLCGFLVVLFRWWLGWRRINGVVREAVMVTEGHDLEALRRLEGVAGIRRPVELRSSQGSLEPGIFGIVRPVLVWPSGISDRLSRAQAEAIIAHELCHVLRRDNLTAAIHMAIQSIFWFHPLLWWLGARLVDERENACDEEVLRLGSEPEVYAESILKTCQFYLESPLVCMAGVTGSDLKKRIERIMTHHFSNKLDVTRKLMLAAAGIAAVAGPIVFGAFSASRAQAQEKPGRAAALAFEVASIKPNNSADRRSMFAIEPGGRLNATNVSVKMLIMMAFDLKPHQLSGGPGWLDSDKYDIAAKPEEQATAEQLKQMVQTLLADRFKFAFHRDSKEESIYALVAGKSGPKLRASDAPDRRQIRMGRGSLELQSASLKEFADTLSRIVGRNVVDRTGIKGTYDIKLEYTPEENQSGMLKGPGESREGGDGSPAPDPSGPSIFTAIQEQLGLKLEGQKGQVETIVIDHVEKPTEN